jgi:hypothetical protein
MWGYMGWCKRWDERGGGEGVVYKCNKKQRPESRPPGNTQITLSHCVSFPALLPFRAAGEDHGSAPRPALVAGSPRTSLG